MPFNLILKTKILPIYGLNSQKMGGNTFLIHHDHNHSQSKLCLKASKESRNSISKRYCPVAGKK